MTDADNMPEAYLPQPLEAVQRSAWFLDQSIRKLGWPLAGDDLAARAKDADLFETLAWMHSGAF